MRPVLRIIGGLPLWLLAACVASPSGERPAVDRLFTRGEIQVAEVHLRDFGFDPGPVDGIFTAETRAAVRAYQARYGLPVSGRLDLETRRELLPGLGYDRVAR
jgi:peptidoglycan hydrolase-like protein with peptidoglycan-binding domain